MLKIINDADVSNFPETGTVIVDDIDALNHLYMLGLNQSTRILTNSPYVKLNFKENTNLVSLDKAVTPSERFLLLKIIGLLSDDLYRNIPDHLLSRPEKIHLIRAIATMGWLHLVKGLKQEYFSDAVLIVRLSNQDHSLCNNDDFPWEDLLVDHAHNMSVYLYKVSYQFSSDCIRRDFKFFERIKYFNLARFKFFALLNFFNFLKKLGFKFKKNIIFGLDNDLLNEMGYSFMLRGYAGTRLASSYKKFKDFQTINMSDDLKNKINFIFKKYLSKFFDLYQLKLSENFFIDKLEDSYSAFRMIKKKFLYELKLTYQDSKNKPSYFFTNYPQPGVYAACVELNIKLVTFQHGHTREILKYDFIKQYPYTKEDSVSDVLFTYNYHSSEISSRSQYCISSVCELGLPARYFKTPSPFLRKKYDLVFVSTSKICQWTDAITQAKNSNFNRVSFEYDLLERVFLKLNKTVLYKPYLENDHFSNRRYLKEFMNNTSHIKYYDHKLDLRFLFSVGKLFITTRATSTLGWCLMAKVPLLFINMHEDFPLEDHVSFLMKKSVFYFDTSDENFFNDLLDFLKLDFLEINKRWREMESEREKLMNYFGFPVTKKTKKVAFKKLIDLQKIA